MRDGKDSADDAKQFAQITVPAKMIDRYQSEGWELISISGNEAYVRRSIRVCSCCTEAI